jgi:hypothetical protein
VFDLDGTLLDGHGCRACRGGVDLRLAAAALPWFESAVDAGLRDEDDSAVFGNVVGHSLRD